MRAKPLDDTWNWNGFVGPRRLRVDGYERVLLRTGEQPVDSALVLRRRAPDKTMIPTIDAVGASTAGIHRPLDPRGEGRPVLRRRGKVRSVDISGSRESREQDDCLRS